MKIILATLLLSISLASQPLMHIVAGRAAWKLADTVCTQDLKWAKPYAKPMAAIGSHIVMDKLIGEAYLGEWQTYIGIVRTSIGYFLEKEDQREEYLQYSFWSLLPDILQKILGWNWAHPEIGGAKVFNLDRDQNELLEELFLASMIFKVKLEF